MRRLRINAMLSRIDHVGIAVRDLDEAIRIYERRLGLRSTGRERLEREGIEIAMIPIGESRIELIMPINPDSRVEKFLQDRGGAVTAGRVPLHPRYLPRDVPPAALDDQAICRVRQCGGDQPPLPLPAAARSDRALRRLRLADADRARR